MKTRFSLLLAALCGLGSLVSLHAQTTAFTYQGRLTTNSAPATGRFDFEFSVFSAASGGMPISGPLALPGVGVANGAFTVALDFGAAVFNGSPRWLGITVRPTGGGIITPLAPRQPLTPTPYAVTALNALTASSVSGVSGHALHARDGSPGNAVFVDNDGKVGVGTTNPVSKLHVYSGAGVNAPPRLESPGGSTFGAGLDFYPSGVAKGYVGVPDAGAAFAPGELMLFGAPDTKVSIWPGQTRSLTLDTSGNVGIGTATPQSTLDIVGSGNALRMAGFQPFLTLVDANAGHARSAVQGVEGSLFFKTEGHLSGSSPAGIAALYNDGNFSVASLTIRGGADLAEPFPMKEEGIEKGSVVIIDREHPGRLKLSTRPYDTQVAGIVSGANGIHPGISLKQEGVLDQGQNVALSGRVYVKADANLGAIQPGDLITTSDTPGHAMKVSDPTKAQGAILGKAMSALNEGTGLVLVLVTLQ